MFTVLNASSAVRYCTAAVRIVKECEMFLLFLCCTVLYFSIKNYYTMCIFLTARSAVIYCTAVVRIITLCV